MSGSCIVLAMLSSSGLADVCLGLLMHNGFEACWVSAKTKPQFLELVRASIDGTTACIPVQSGSQSGIGYTICNVANGCGAGLAGCVVSMQAGPFSGDFVAGHFTGPGTTSDISVPVTTTVFSPCTISLTAISLGYTLDYLMQTDGSEVSTARTVDSAVAIGSYAHQQLQSGAGNDCRLCSSGHRRSGDECGDRHRTGSANGYPGSIDVCFGPWLICAAGNPSGTSTAHLHDALPASRSSHRHDDPETPALLPREEADARAKSSTGSRRSVGPGPGVPRYRYRRVESKDYRASFNAWSRSAIRSS
jgi:hypothetical protein